MKKIAVLLILAAGTMWGIIGYFVRELNAWGLSSLEVVAIRMSISAVVFSLFAVVLKRKLFIIKLRDLWCFIGTGVVSVALFSFCYFKAIELSELSVASILLYTAPAFVMVFSAILFKEKITAVKVVSLVLAIVGCVFVTGVLSGGATVEISAVLFGVMSGVCYALYSIFSRFALKRGYSPLTITLYTFIFSGVATLLITDVKKVASAVTQSVSSIGFCVLFAVLSCVLPYLTYTVGLKYISSSTASIIASVEPVVATVMGAFVFNETVSAPFGYIGIALVLLSIVLINLPQKNKL